MKRAIIPGGLLAAVVASVVATTPAFAADTFASYTPGTTNITGGPSTASPDGQTFTSAYTGDISSLSIKVYEGSGNTNNLSASILAVDGSRLPTGSALGTFTFAAGSVGTTGGVTTVSAVSSAAVTAGVEYAIVFEAVTGWVLRGNYGITSDPYTGGTMVSYSGGSWRQDANQDWYFAVEGTRASASPAGGSDSTSAFPAPVLQQFALAAGGTCVELAPDGLNWSGVASGGWSESWAQWPNDGAGGAVCTRTLSYSSSKAQWIVE